MSYKTTLRLLAVLIILGGVAYFAETRSSAGPRSGEADKKLQIYDLKESQLEGLKVSEGDKTTVVRRGPSSQWTLEPQGEKADTIQVDSVALRLLTLRAFKVVAEKPEDLAQYGLDKPQLTVTMELTGGKSETLSIGTETPIETGYYATRKGSTEVFILSSSLVKDLKKMVEEPRGSGPSGPLTAGR